MKNDNEICKLFGDTQYVLDKTLQRSYEWKIDNAIKLINDIRTTKIKRDDGQNCKYNIGDFITYTKKNDKYGETKYLCDGQQRLTTLVLTFANIRNSHKNPEAKAAKRIERILCIYNKWTDEEAKILELKEDDNEILNKIIDGKINELTKEDKKSHLVKVYNKITEKFTKDMTDSELGSFFDSIWFNTSYFERECECEEEAIKQFNNLNGGQQSLSKSRVGVATLYEIYNKMSNFDEKIEKFLYELSNMKPKNLKDFLCLYCYYKDEECRESDIPKSINKIMKKTYNLSDIFSFYDNIYAKYIENNTNPFMTQTCLHKIWVDLYTDKYLHIKDIDDTEKDTVYKKCEWAYICNRIKNGGSGEANLFNGLIKNFDNKEKLSDYVIEKLKDKGVYEKVNIINEYKQNVSNRGNDLFIRLFLIIEEEYKKSLNPKEEITIKDKPTLEHIFPRNPNKNEEYKCDETIKNRFGNKTVIGDRANKSLSNKNYSEKREVYKQSPYDINNRLYEKYEDWTNESVEDNEKFYFEMLNKHYKL